MVATATQLKPVVICRAWRGLATVLCADAITVLAMCGACVRPAGESGQAACPLRLAR